MRLGEADRDYAVVGALPVETPGLIFIYGRQSCDKRGDGIDAGNARFGGQEALIVFDDVFIPWERVFMDGEYDFAASLVERFTCYHRRSYVCKTGLGDVLIGAAAQAAEYNGAQKASHIKDKLVEMTHLNESIYAAGIASSYQGHEMDSGVYLSDGMLANVCKHNVTRYPFDLARMAQDIAGGLVATMPSEEDLRAEKTGPLLRKYLRGTHADQVEDRMRMMRLIENMTMGRNAVGYLTESIHGAGSPQAQRVQIARQMQIEVKKGLARNLAGIEEERPEADHEDYYGRVFEV
jgi:4-hydroxybutyryl-CoA dehydratase/vinylacetyl-CoA-Delta-isomerase